MKITILLVLAFLCTSAIFGDAFGTFSSVVDFNANIKDLAEHPDRIDSTKLYLLDGTVSSVRVIKSEPDDFYAEVEFLRAEWQDLESIHTYKIVLVFSKPIFSSIIPVRAPQNAEFGQIVPNSKGIALVSLIKDISADAKNSIPTFMVHSYRSLR